MPPQQPRQDQARRNAQGEARSKDVDLLQRFQTAGGNYEQFTTDELRKIAQLKGLVSSHEPPMSEKMLRFADKIGAPEIVGGGIGAAFGGIPGGMLGAATGRAAAEAMKSDDPSLTNPDIQNRAVESGMLQGALPGAGKIVSAIGKGTMRAALPITESMAEAASKDRLNLHGGVTQIVDEILNKTPGVTPQAAYDSVSKLLSKARADEAGLRKTASFMGHTVSPQRMASTAEDIINRDIRGSIHSPGQLSGAESVLDETLEMLGQRTVQNPVSYAPGDIMRLKPQGGGTITIPAPRLNVDDAKNILSRTPFVSGSTEVAGVKEGVRATRTGLSEAYKHATGAEGPLKAQAQNLPKLELLDKLLVNAKSPVAEGEVLLSGFRPRIFGIINPSAKTRFVAGKVMNRTGKTASAPETTNLLRMLSGILGEDEQGR